MDLCPCVSEEDGDNAGARATLRSDLLGVLFARLLFFAYGTCIALGKFMLCMNPESES